MNPDPHDPLSLTDPDAEDPIDRPPPWVARARRVFRDHHSRNHDPQTFESLTTLLALMKSAECDDLPMPDLLADANGSILLTWNSDPGGPSAGRMVTVLANGRFASVATKLCLMSRFRRPDLASIDGLPGRLREALGWAFPERCGGDGRLGVEAYLETDGIMATGGPEGGRCG